MTTTYIISTNRIEVRPTGISNRPIHISVPCVMTNGENVFTGTWNECIEIINTECPGVEFVQTQDAEHNFILTSTGRVNRYVVDEECGLFYREV